MKFKKLHIGATPKNSRKTLKSRFLRDVSFLELHTGDNNHPLITVRGEDAHLYSVILNPKGFAKRMYDMASAVSQSRSFFSRENSNYFVVAQIDSKSCKTYSEPLFFEKKI